MDKKKDKKPQPRDRVLVVKVTEGEKREITEYTKRQCVNVSALVRKLLFEKMRTEGQEAL